MVPEAPLTHNLKRLNLLPAAPDGIFLAQAQIPVLTRFHHSRLLGINTYLGTCILQSSKQFIMYSGQWWEPHAK